MPTTVALWTGREVRALRESRRMSVREFAAHLGVSDRMVSKWEAGGTSIRPRPLNQQALDTSVSLADAAAKQRFARILGDHSLFPQQSRRADLHSTASQVTATQTAEIIRHPVDGKAMVLVEGGPAKPTSASRPIWLGAFYIDIATTTNADYQRFLAATHAPDDTSPHATTIVDDPFPAAQHPILDLTWDNICAYARWADKQIPTSIQWKRATQQSVAPPDLREWCQTDARPTHYGPPSDHGGFRTAVAAADLHALLAI
jgi:transcriptional regulator with XRE-family HTH domain